MPNIKLPINLSTRHKKLYRRIQRGDSEHFQCLKNVWECLPCTFFSKTVELNAKAVIKATDGFIEEMLLYNFFL